VLAEKITYRFLRPPRRGDIVVFDDPTEAHPQLIKRVIATGGQTVDIRDGSVYVDDKLISEPYLHGVRTDPGSVPLPAKVPEGYVWLMGDNRPNSGDSRYIGPQPIAAIRGRAIWTYWPLARFGPLR
jgi:signal peptidase I